MLAQFGLVVESGHPDPDADGLVIYGTNKHT
jgi:hypothetical protein